MQNPSMFWMCYILFAHEFGGSLHERLQNFLSSYRGRSCCSNQEHVSSSVFWLLTQAGDCVSRLWGRMRDRLRRIASLCCKL